MIPARLLALAAVLALSACATGPIGGARLGQLTPPPATLPATSDDGSDMLLGGVGFSVQDPDLDWGVGVLRPNGFERVDLPLFSAPNGAHWGWVTQGRVYDQIRRRTLPDRSDAAVLVGDARAFLVLDRRPDGWLKIRFGHPDDRDRGLAWTRADLAGSRRASYLDWSRALEHAQGLVYRNAEAAHNLRDGPSTSAAVVERLEGTDFDMAVLELRGDWMRVRVTSPPACAGSTAEDMLLGARETREVAGWIAWRSNARGPWVVSAAGPRCRPGT